jgi:probable F420-dependent oxidoreductase
VKYGLTMFPTDYSITPKDLAVEVESRGFESLWFPEHTPNPVDRKSPWPGGDELPKMYYDVMEPFVALATAAAVTTTLKLGTGICLVVQRDPLQTAKNVATLDRVSDGRFLFGIGAGWNAEEMANHGTVFERRFKLMRERIEAMKAIWTESKAEYHGEFVDFDPVMTWPKPVQQPHPPIHVGGAFPGGPRRAARYGNGWMPIYGRDSIVEKLPDVHKLVEEAGRDPSEFEVSVFGGPADPEQLRGLRDGGITRVIFGLPPAAPDVVLPLLDRYAAAMNEVG